MGASWEEVSGLLPDPGALSRGDLEPEYEIDGHYYAGQQILLFFDDNDRLIYLEALPLAPDEVIE